MAKPDELDGTQRAAILLMSLGEQDAANLLKQLDAKDVQRLGMAMAELKEVSRDQMTSVLDKFIGIVDGKANIASGSQDYVRRVLTQAVGKQKTELLLDRVSTGQTGQGIEALKWMEAKAVAQIISGEHPQIGAIVLAHLESEQSASVLPLLSEEMRTEVLMRIAALNEVPQSALTELDQLVERQANATPPSALRRIGGARTVANILNSMEKDKSGEELGKIEKADGEMHQQIKDLLFVFDNLLDVDDRGIQALLREVGSDTLAVALRGAEPDVQDKILRNMSKRAAEILKDDMEARGPVKLADVEAAHYLYDLIVATFATETARFKNEDITVASTARRVSTRSFQLGLAHGIRDKLRSMKSERDIANRLSTGRDLVPIKVSVIEDELEKLGLSFHAKAQSRKRMVAPGAYHAGREAGQKFEPRRGVEAA